jgi:predicted Rossmann fold nucleotide-binding protein DprA/Smf involved in DNA uptake
MGTREKVVLSGFNSPLEQQVLRSMLRRHGRAVKLLAHALDDYRAPAEEMAPLADGRLLVFSNCPATVTRTTRATALARNRLVLALTAAPLRAIPVAGQPVAWTGG